MNATTTLADTNGTTPFAWYEELEAQGGIVWDEGFGAWMVSSQEMVKQIGRDDDGLWETPYFLREDRPPPLGLTAEEWRWYLGSGSEEMMLVTEGSRHALQRRWLLRALSPQLLETWKQDLIGPIAHSCIDRFIGDGRAELNVMLADQVAPRVMAAVMGLPHADDAWVAQVGDLISRRIALKMRLGESGRHEELVQDSFEATRELHEVLRPFVEERRLRPGDDLISHVWRDAAELFGHDHDVVDIVAMAVVLWEAGAHSTVYGSSNALYLLASEPELQERLRSGDRVMAKRVVEEALRLFGPVFFRVRVATEDVPVGKATVKRGEQVVLLLVAAGRDSDQYSCPFAADPTRANPTNHVAFFHGPRRCSGASLARAELETLTTAMLERTNDLCLDEQAPPPRLDGLLLRRWNPLHVRFTAR